MSTFEAAIPVIMSHEGTDTNFWVDDPADRGGETCWGISMLMIKAEKMTPQDLGLDIPAFFPGCLKKMTKATAQDLYCRFFWNKYGFGAILDQTAATKVFDCAVNCGPKRAAKIVQGAVNTLTPGKLIVDGAFGPMTFGAVNALDSRKFVKAMSVVMADYYESIIAARPANAKFRNNWLRRAQWGLT